MTQYLDQTGLEQYTTKMVALMQGMISEALTDLSVVDAIEETLEDYSTSDEINDILESYYTADELDEKIEELKSWVSEEIETVITEKLEELTTS